LGTVALTIKASHDASCWRIQGKPSGHADRLARLIALEWSQAEIMASDAAGANSPFDAVFPFVAPVLDVFCETCLSRWGS
jgi:hypothetical protein